MIGERIAKYDVLEEIGHGGMATVYRGEDTDLKREVAIKVLHPHLADREESRARFRREAQAVARLRHRNILEIFDYSGSESDQNYIVMEFIRGFTLKDFLDREDIDLPEIGALLGVPVCQAVAHAHSLGIVHRDIKPENIMISDEGVIKLTDFGIAAMVDTEKLTLTGQLLGSPAYMAPEVISGGRIDRRTDIFSIGIILYQLTVGELPFKGKNPHQVLSRIAEADYIRPLVANPRVGDGLDAIICKALAREPDERYQSTDDLLGALEQHLARVGIDEPDDAIEAFFENPHRYQREYEPILVDQLLEVGRTSLAAGRTAAALATFNRVLGFDPGNEEVQRELAKLNRRRSLRVAARMGALVLALVLVAVGGAWALSKIQGEKPGQASNPTVALSNSNMGASASMDPMTAPVADAAVAARMDAMITGFTPSGTADAGPAPRSLDAGTAAMKRPVMAGMGQPRIFVAPKRKIHLRVTPAVWQLFHNRTLLTPEGREGVPFVISARTGDGLLFRGEKIVQRPYKIKATDRDTIRLRLVWRKARFIVLTRDPKGVEIKHASFKFIRGTYSGEFAVNTVHKRPYRKQSCQIEIFSRAYRARKVDLVMGPGKLERKVVTLQPRSP